MEPWLELSPGAQAIWRQVCAARPEVERDQDQLASYCAATARARALAADDHSIEAWRLVERQRRMADRLGLGDTGKEPIRQRAPRQMVRVRALKEVDGSYVANDGSDVMVRLGPGEEADVTESYARQLVALGLAEVV